DLGGDVDVAVAGERVQPLQGVLRHDEVGRVSVGEAVPRAPAVDLRPPGFQRRLVHRGALHPPGPDQVLQHVGDVADDGHVHLHVLVDGRGVDVDVDLLRPGRERVEAPADAVVEARTDAHHDIAIVHG